METIRVTKYKKIRASTPAGIRAAFEEFDARAPRGLVLVRSGYDRPRIIATEKWLWYWVATVSCVFVEDTSASASAPAGGWRKVVGL